MSTAMLAGHRVTHARVTLPAWGIAWAEASIDEEVELSGRVSLVVADLTFSGTIISGGAGPKGRASFRLAAGAGGWGRALPARSYANDAGIKASTVLADAARECGETIDVASVASTVLGPAFAREAAPAARVLEQVAPAGWYVGEDGTTRVGRRAALALAAPATIIVTDRAFGTVSLAAEAIASLVPGVVVEGIEAVDVMHELAPGAALRTTIWGAGVAPTSRRLAAWRRIADQLDPRRKYRGITEYRLVTQDGERLNLQPIRVSTGMPDLQRVPVRPGIPGAKATHALGSRMLVTFVDADPARPVVVGFEDAEGDGFVATLLEIGGSVALPAARKTDIVQAGPFLGSITGLCSPKVRIG